MDTKPLISVMLPIYNVKDYLPRCLESLLRQDYPNLELLLIDDGSTDGTAEVCDDWAREHPTIKAFHKPNGGVSDARNFAVEHAAGTYVTFVDPDDTVDETYVSYLYGLIEKYGTAMSVCQHRVCFETGKVQELGRPGDECLTAHDCLERMLYHDVIDTSCWGKLYLRTLFEGVQYPKGRIFEDIAATHRLFSRSGNVAVGYESRYSYIMRNVSIVNCSFNPSKLDLLPMTDGMGQEVVRQFPDLKAAALRRSVYARFSTLNQMLNVKGYEKERSELIAYIREHRKEVLSDPKTPKRDRLAIAALSLGFPAYRVLWKLYLVTIGKV